MSALLIGNFLSAGNGSRGVCEDLAEQLRCAGWRVFTASSKENRILRLSDMLLTAWRNRGEYGVAQVDVYSGPAFFWAEAVCLLLRMLGKPRILTLHGGNLPAFASRRPRRVRALLHSSAAVTTPSRFLLEAMSEYHPALILQPNPIDVSRYQFRIRQKPKPELIWLRAFHEIYNPSLAPRVVALLAEEFPNVRLTMIGPDKGDGSFPAVIKHAAELGVAHRISFSGKVPKPDIPDWLAKADIFINTTNVDNTPVSVLEAMAAGTCIVSTNVGGIPYLLRNEKEALLVPPNNEIAMAAAIKRYLCEEGLAERLSKNARRVAEEFDWATVLLNWKKLLTGVNNRQAGIA
jgi:glycosyltransferase involved in cell wall biosynthesis